MDYIELKDYLMHKMKMSHIYQPVMIKELLGSKSPVSTRQIASKFLEYDTSQIEYYEKVTKSMPGPVLIRHGIVQRESTNYSLKLEDHLTEGQIKELISLCDAKINAYIQLRGDKIWQHRRLGDRVVPGSIKYEVFRRAGFRCQLCGTSADERALEVDHIIPHKLGGPDNIDNFQALCYKCNASKRDTDSTDFRDWKDMYITKKPDCLFCDPDESRVILKTELAYVLKDSFPVTEGHVLIVPKRHVASFFDLFAPEINSCVRLINELRKQIEKEAPKVKGFNIGVNVDEAAGQTISHCHLHLIPRRFGDVPNPRGGVRNMIPGKGDYPENGG